VISILLADDHEIFRKGLQMLLNNQPDFRVIGEADNGLEAVALAERLRPDVVIVDMMMPGLSGLDVTFQIKQRLPNCRIIILSMHDDESYVVTALKNGATGYVLKDSSASDLAQAVHAVAADRRFLSQPLSDRAIQSYINQVPVRVVDSYNTLTQREREILHLSAEGQTRPEIARRLNISIRTVETHRANLMHKLELHSQSELVAYAFKNGIL
jgi:DNA-binding NarL/FixJ family response regulator